MKIIKLAILLLIPFLVHSQKRPYHKPAIIHIPTEYLKSKKIESITSIPIDSMQGTTRTVQYYEDGRTKQTISYHPKSRFQSAEIDSNYTGNEVKYLRSFYYNKEEESSMYAETWIGLKDHNIRISKQTTYPEGDTIYWQVFGNETTYYSKGEYIPRIVDTVNIALNQYALLSRTKDTIQTKHIFKDQGLDSIVYRDAIEDFMQYEVYNGSTMVSSGIQTKTDHWQIKFNREGYPYQVLHFIESTNQPKSIYYVTYTIFER